MSKLFTAYDPSDSERAVRPRRKGPKSYEVSRTKKRGSSRVLGRKLYRGHRRSAGYFVSVPFVARCLPLIVRSRSLGGIFSSAAADFGVDGVTERLQQVGVMILVLNPLLSFDPPDTSQIAIPNQRRSVSSFNVD